MLARRTMLATGAALAATPALSAPRNSAEAHTRALHQRLICLDTHLDTPANFPRPWLGHHAAPFLRHAPLSQVDYSRMVEGGLDGGSSRSTPRRDL